MRSVPTRATTFRRLTIVAALLVAAVGSLTAAAAVTVTIGQAAGDVICGVDGTTFATSGSIYTVPSGTWRLTDWSTRAGVAGGQMAAVVVRPAATAGTYEVIGVSAVQTLTPDVVNTFAASMGVRSGDILGLWATAETICGTFGGDNSYGFEIGPPPSVGDILTPSPSFQNGFMDISATLAAPPPRPPDRFGYCAVAGNTWQDGSPIPVGTFLNLVWDQPSKDAHYSGATIASFVQGRGITCDPAPAGYVQQGLATNEMHVPGGVYPYWAPGS
ncbi:MAG: hypothetical protein ACXVY3_08595 [Gaiellaceae bacterium]